MGTLLRTPLILLLLSAACSHSNPGNVSPSNQTRAKIENRSSLDMDLSVSRNDGRSSPLGLVPAGETATFALPVGMTAGAAWVRFQARPARGTGETTVSEPFPITAGDEINWSVSPQ